MGKNLNDMIESNENIELLSNSNNNCQKIWLKFTSTTQH